MKTMTMTTAEIRFLHHPTYRFATLATPHSRQRGLSRDVINPQAGHILCERNPVLSGFILRIQRSSRIVNSTISRPREMLVTLIKATLPASSAMTNDPMTNAKASASRSTDTPTSRS